MYISYLDEVRDLVSSGRETSDNVTKPKGNHVLGVVRRKLNNQKLNFLKEKQYNRLPGQHINHKCIAPYCFF